MGKFIESTLWCIGYFFLSSILIGSFVFGLLNIGIEAAFSEETIKNLVQTIIETIVIGVILYIFMRINGHKGNITAFSGKVTVKDMLIPIIISVLLFQTLSLLNDIDIRVNLPSEYYLFSANKQDALASLLPQFILQSAAYALFMIFGYNAGYKKYDKERTEMMSKKMSIRADFQ
ncbi:MAG: hypothetical protein FWH48_07325 [Oscillospiraceae bacterium]|nr:hypothetical protein [Oscillospiraceae bacterium]